MEEKGSEKNKRGGGREVHMHNHDINMKLYTTQMRFP